ncbi:MAG: mechanosensitive ion channel [Salinivirgaceae bacterium]|nr:mechanosensitive ion channel [Salinivirgaceae bacterium]
MKDLLSFFETTYGKVLFVIVIAFIAHVLVLFIRKIERIILNRFTKKKPKWNSVRTLGFSIIIFCFYFLAFGYILQILGFSLKAYLATASVIGLAIGFGTQGVIQDVITGITIVLSDLVDVGELVEVNGTTGVVKSINMRFIEIEDQHGTKAFIPNRTISKVVNYPKGYLSCSIDFTMGVKEIANEELFNNLNDIIKSFKEQYPTIFRGSSSLYDDKETSSGKRFARLKLRIWPGRIGMIEGIFKQELLTLLKENNPDFKDWMLAINYEVENNRKSNKKEGGQKG